MPADDSLKPATKGDLAAVEERLEGRIAGVEGRLGAVEGELAGVKGELAGVKGELAAVEGRLIEAVRDAQTEVLRAFERYAAGEQIKLRRLQADLSNVDASTDRRLEIVEQRLFEIEKKLLLKPPDAA
ncbi:MAG: hypothetical protein ACLQVN_18115 [Bryobacteraceae bacterium]